MKLAGFVDVLNALVAKHGIDRAMTLVCNGVACRIQEPGYIDRLNTLVTN